VDNFAPRGQFLTWRPNFTPGAGVNSYCKKLALVLSHNFACYVNRSIFNFISFLFSPDPASVGTIKGLFDRFGFMAINLAFFVFINPIHDPIKGSKSSQREKKNHFN
jgi:hypothetical protein